MLDMVQNSLRRLEKYCSEENFIGWDPYDGLNSKVFDAVTPLANNRLTRLMWIQFIKKMPINVRPFLKIEKGFNAKGLALFIAGYANLNQSKNKYPQALSHLTTLADKVISLSTPGYAGNCWGYNFDWESRAFFQKKFTPTIVATSYVANALLDAYDETLDRTYLDAAVSSKDFILNDLNRTYDDKGDFVFSYSPNDHTAVFNASLLGAKLLSRIYHYTKEEALLVNAKKAVSYCCNYQNPDGSWYYSTLPFHQWIDSFHTGFNLECIWEYGHYSGDHSYQSNFENGINYYLNCFFDSEGRSKYYNNSLYPIDIHAPSQLVILLSKTNLFQQNKLLIDKVMKWTIINMQSKNGYFFYQKKRFYTNKIPYMRWSQAWIFYAFACYVKNTNNHS